MVFYQLWAAIALCQLIYPYRHRFPGLYWAASEVHLDALAAYLN